MTGHRHVFTPHSKQAFSLVELSIVLVILGLLTGGILTGQNLIRAAELRSVVTEYQSYQTAVMTFRDKYFALPGDMTNAEAFWGTMATGTCPNATAGTGTQTCNGDGSGEIELNAVASQSNEIFTFWQHLANAGLIEGSYTGIAGSGGAGLHSIVGENSPASKMGNVTWTARLFGDFTGNSVHYDESYGNVFIVGEIFPNSSAGNSFLSPEEAWNIDVKLDDGLPGKGRLIAAGLDGWNNAGGTLDRCTLSSSSADKDKGYDLDETSKLCFFLFPRAF